MQGYNQNSESKNFVTISDELILTLVDKVILFLKEKQKEEREVFADLEKVRFQHAQQNRQQLMKILKDSNVIQNAMEGLKKWSDKPYEFHYVSKPKSNIKPEDIFLELNKLFNNHSEKLRPNLTEKTFELLKNIFESQNEEDFNSNITKFKLHTLSIIDLSVLSKYVNENLNDSEKKIVDALLIF